MSYQEKTDEELKRLALDIHEGRVWTDRHGVESFQTILMFLDDAARAELKATEVNMVYEYIDKAGPRSINGRPTFFSFQVLNTKEVLQLSIYYEQLRKQRQEFLGQTAEQTT